MEGNKIEKQNQMLKIVLLGIVLLMVPVISISAYYFLTKSVDSDNFASRDSDNAASRERKQTSTQTAATPVPSTTPAIAATATPSPAPTQSTISSQSAPKTTAASVSRIQFPKGQSSTTVSGITSFRNERTYTLGANKGQVMTVRLNSNTGGVAFNIYGKQYDSDATITIPATNNNIKITVYVYDKTLPTDTNYSLYVSIQ